MKITKLFLVVFVLITVGVVVGTQSVASAQEALLVKIHGVGDDALKGIFLNPETAYIKKDTIVVWLSGVKEQDVKVEFADGKKCKSVTAYSMGYYLDKERWCYVTSYVPFGATSSLQFLDVGEYVYKVTTKEGNISATGRIIVEYTELES
ncbi:MAG: hypothetical protein R6U50_07325 [Desulfobacterales bacterium]